MEIYKIFINGHKNPIDSQMTIWYDNATTKKKEVMKCCDVQKMKGYDERSVQQIVLECGEECGIVKETKDLKATTRIVSLNQYILWIGLCVIIAIAIQFWFHSFV